METRGPRSIDTGTVDNKHPGLTKLKVETSKGRNHELFHRIKMCLCLGPSRSGKTLLLKHLQGGEEIDDASHTVPTNGTNLFTIKSNDGHFDMVIREIGGSMAPIWKHYFDRVHKILYVVDASNLCQISAAGVLFYSLLVEPRLENTKIGLVLGKMDLSYRQMRNEALLMLHFARLQREVKQNIRVFEASGMTGQGVEEIRSWLFDPETMRKAGGPPGGLPLPVAK